MRRWRKIVLVVSTTVGVALLVLLSFPSIAGSMCRIDDIKEISKRPDKAIFQVQYYIEPFHSEPAFIAAYVPNKASQNSNFTFPGGSLPGIPKGQSIFFNHHNKAFVEIYYVGSQSYTSSTIEIEIYDKNQSLCSSVFHWSNEWKFTKCRLRGDETFSTRLHPWSGKARPGYPEMTIEQMGKLAQLRQNISGWIKHCGSSVSGQDKSYCPEVTGKRDCTSIVSSTGDANLYNGLLCLSGEGAHFCGFENVRCAAPIEEPFCKAVRDAQGPDGRWWRSPDHVGIECEGRVSFSRDMALGTLAYLVVTRDQNAALEWWRFIKNNDLLLCTDDSWLYDFCGLFDYTRCLWGSREYYSIFYDVFRWIGLTPPEEIKEKTFDNCWYTTCDADTDRRDHTCDCLQWDHFHPLLVADQYLIEQYVLGEDPIDREGINCLAGPDFPDFLTDSPLFEQLAQKNPYFAFLKEGSSQHVAKLTIDNCKCEPDTGDYCNPGNSWMVDDWKNGGMGWDCIFMINLLLKPMIDVDKDGSDDFIVNCGADKDDDGVPDVRDNCPLISNPDQKDSDGDIIGDLCDNCPDDANPTQDDLDSDGLGDVCDPDIDGDGCLNEEDRCPKYPPPDSKCTSMRVPEPDMYKKIKEGFPHIRFCCTIRTCPPARDDFVWRAVRHIRFKIPCDPYKNPVIFIPLNPCDDNCSKALFLKRDIYANMVTSMQLNIPADLQLRQPIGLNIFVIDEDGNMVEHHEKSFYGEEKEETANLSFKIVPLPFPRRESIKEEELEMLRPRYYLLIQFDFNDERDLEKLSKMELDLSISLNEPLQKK